MEHLTEMQRYKLSWMLENKFSKTLIASELHVNRSTVHRELDCNSNKNTGVYDPGLAQQKYKKRMRKKPKSARFTDKMKALARDNLRHRGRKRQKRANKNSYRGLIPNRVDISERPSVVDERSRLGDIEVDTVVGRGRSGNIVTMVDRASGVLWAELVPTLEAGVVCPAVSRMLLPYKHLLKTITFDNGREFSRHAAIANALGTDNYFTKPYHSWEKGSVENANGLLRQYFRKGSSFLGISQDDVQRAYDLINHRPRKRFGFRSPIEVFFLYLHQQNNHHLTPEVLRL